MRSINNKIYKTGIIIFILLICIENTNFAFFNKSKISGVVWNDINNNGIQEDGENGIKDVTVVICKSDGTETKKKYTTGDDGKYEFDTPSFKFKLKFKYPDKYNCNGIYKTLTASNVQTTDPLSYIVYTIPEKEEYKEIVDKIRDGMNIKCNDNFKDNDVIYYTDSAIKDKQGNGYMVKNPLHSIYEIFNKNNCGTTFGLLPNNVTKLKCIDIVIADNNITKQTVDKNTIDSSKVNYIILFTDDANEDTRNFINNINSPLIKTGELNDWENDLSNSLPEGISYNNMNEASGENILDNSEKGYAYSKDINESENISKIDCSLSESAINNSWGNDNGNNYKTDNVTYTDTTNDIVYTYVSGKIFKDVENDLITDWIGVRLINTDNSTIERQILTNTGEYTFDVTGLSGNYKIQFIHGAGQNCNFSDYEVMSKNNIDSLNWCNNVITKSSYKGEVNNITWKEAHEVYAVTDMNDWINKFSDNKYNKYFCFSESDNFSLDGLLGKKVSMGLTKRANFELNLEKDLTAAKITLSDGSTLKEETFSAGDSPYDLPVYWYIDDEIMLGATISLEYQIKLKASYDVTVDLLDYLSYNTGSIMYNSEDSLLSLEEKNSISGLQPIDKTEARNINKFEY